jgi:hypothetical protein
VRFARLAIPIAVLAFAVAGCGGGSNVTVQEVPGGPVHLTVPGGDQLAPRPSATPTPTVTATATATSGTGTASAAPTASPQSSTQQQAPAQTTPQGTGNGGAAAPNPTPPPGADKQQFETYCQQNPGAC